MIVQVRKSVLSGRAPIPASKSHTIRAVTLASLAEGTSTIHNPLISSDALSAARCYEALGAEVDISDESKWIIKGLGGRIAVKSGEIDVGNSGTTLRLAAGSAALASPEARIRFTGDAQIRSRPISPLLDALRDLGAHAVSLNNNGSAPIEIGGRLRGGVTSIECFTSQYLSSLLLACPPASGNSEIRVPLLNEPDYVRITLDWLEKQNIRIEREGLSRFYIPGNQRYLAFDLPIPADFSSATFFLCAGAILGRDILLEGLDFADSQPDKRVVDYLRAMGADIAQEPEGIRVRRSELTGIEIDMNRTPDALPAMAVTAAFARGTTRLVNVPQARKKETDRIACMACELKKLGADVEELPDGLVVFGGKPLSAARLHGWGDHRIVMALCIAGLALDRPTEIDTAEAMNVTFPTFTTLMQTLGADIQVKP
jgi:3-phosphoshikimate 1-carboxyvinyltransferase